MPLPAFQLVDTPVSSPPSPLADYFDDADVTSAAMLAAAYFA